MDIHDEARKAMIDAHKTAEEVAREAGISKEWLRQILRGRVPGRKYRSAIARALGWKRWPEEAEEEERASA